MTADDVVRAAHAVHDPSVAEDEVLHHEERVQRGAHPLAYPVLRALRNRPAVRVPGLGVVVSDAATAREVLLDTEGFSKIGPGSPADLWTPVLGPSVLLNMEGTEHAALRRTLTPLFTPSSVRALTATRSERLDRLAARLLAGENVDLVPVVGDLAGSLICHLVGLGDTGDAVRDQLRRAQEIVGLVRLHRRGLTRSQVARARAVLDELSEPARAAYRDGGTQTVPGRMRELGLSEREAMGAVGAFVLTGTETVQSFVPRLVAITHDAGVLDRLLMTSPSDRWRGRVVEEALRTAVPTPVMLRSVTAEREVAGVRVRPGDRVVIVTISCCRGAGPFDPGREADPAVRHLWFGAGPHFCLGMPLAMAQIDSALAALAPVAAAGRPVSVVRRRVARRVLIPAYRELVVTA